MRFLVLFAISLNSLFASISIDDNYIVSEKSKTVYYMPAYKMDVVLSIEDTIDPSSLVMAFVVIDQDKTKSFISQLRNQFPNYRIKRRLYSMKKGSFIRLGQLNKRFVLDVNNGQKSYFVNPQLSLGEAKVVLSYYEKHKKVISDFELKIETSDFLSVTVEKLELSCSDYPVSSTGITDLYHSLKKVESKLMQKSYKKFNTKKNVLGQYIKQCLSSTDFPMYIDRFSQLASDLKFSSASGKKFKVETKEEHLIDSAGFIKNLRQYVKKVRL